MSRFRSSLYRPYGAYELKATYQRHLLFGMLAACGLVLLLVAIGWALGGGEATTVINTGGRQTDTVWIRSFLNEMVSYTRTEDDIGSIAPPVIEGVVAGLNPVEDDSFDEEPVSLATRDERAVMIGGGGEPGEGEDEGIGSGGSGGGGEVVYLPKREEFVKAEVQPELIHSVTPEYPRFAKDAGLEGRVIIKALVGPEGSVLDAVVYVSSGHVLLDKAALAVAGKYKYKPAIQNRNPIAIWVTYKVEFRLD